MIEFEEYKVKLNDLAPKLEELRASLNIEGAQAFIDWMLSDEASELIAKYGEAEYGVALFNLL